MLEVIASWHRRQTQQQREWGTLLVLSGATREILERVYPEQFDTTDPAPDPALLAEKRRHLAEIAARQGLTCTWSHDERAEN